MGRWNNNEVQTTCLNFKLSAYHRARGVMLGTWPGDTSDEAEENSQGQDGDQKPGKDDAYHPQAKQHQGQVLEQHLCLHGEAHVDWRGDAVGNV